MSATRRQFNVINTSFTPTGGSAQNYTGVTGVTMGLGGSIATFDGDNDRFPTVAINDFNNPTVTVSAADLGGMLSTPPGTRGVLTFTYRDARGFSGGNLVFTVSVAIVSDVSANQPHRQFGQGSITFGVESPDGQTNPVSYVFV